MPSINAIVGITPKMATKLRKHGIRTTEGLLRRADTRKGRTELSSETGIDADLLLEWVLLADLMRVKGIGGEYAALLTAAGSPTIRDLRRRSAKALMTRLGETNDEHRLVRRLPTPAMVEGWILSAADVEPAVKK